MNYFFGVIIKLVYKTQTFKCVLWIDLPEPLSIIYIEQIKFEQGREKVLFLYTVQRVTL